MNFLRDLFGRDIWLKLFSLALAVLTWKIVHLAIAHQVSPAAVLPIASPERVFANIPVLVISTAADARTFKVRPDLVEVTVRGEAPVVEKMQASDIRALVDLRDIESAQNLKKHIDILTPGGINWSQALPGEVQVTVGQAQ
jgi:YbbR-like protein